MTYIARLFVSILIIIFCSSFSLAEDIVGNKVLLAKFTATDDKIVNLPKSSPFWPQVNYHILSMDDAGRIYLLNLWNNEILRFSRAGKLQKTIPLPIKLYRFEYRNGELQVSGDGKRIFVSGYDQSEKLQQMILNEKGEIEKRIPNAEIVWNFPDVRLCNTTNYLFKRGSILYDNNFQLLQERFLGFSDSEGKYKVDNREHILVKYKQDGGKLWEKKFDGSLGILGVDSSNHLYLTGTFNKSDKESLYRLDSKGRITGKAIMPNPFPLLTQNEKDAWGSSSSEEPLSFFKLICSGDVYLIFQLGELPALTYKRWLKGGEYYIYRFEFGKK